jgi:hypothetical protein
MIFVSLALMASLIFSVSRFIVKSKLTMGRRFEKTSPTSRPCPRHGASLIGLNGRGSLPLSSNFTKSRRPGCSLPFGDRARSQRRRKDQPAIGAEYDEMIAAHGLHECRVRHETGKAEKD